MDEISAEIYAKSCRILENSTLSSEEIETFTEDFTKMIIYNIGIMIKEKNLGEKEALALLVSLFMKVIKVFDE